MNREEVKEYIAETYAADEDFPWMRHPGYSVFLHRNDRKWFALIMDVPNEKLGLSGPGALDILNVKCDPILMGSFKSEPGFFPAYHMNKASWISIALDGSVSDQKIKLLLDLSYDLTNASAAKHPPKAQGKL